MTGQPQAEWIEGVTATWVACEHDVKILTGTYLRSLIPTGKHPECLREFLLEQAMNGEAGR